MRLDNMFIDDELDEDGELQIEINDEFAFLCRDDVVELRDHLSELLRNLES